MLDYMNLTDSELLTELIGDKGSADCIKEAVNKYSSVPKLVYNYSEDELRKIKGIGTAKIKKLSLLKELIRRLNVYDITSTVKISSPKDLADLIQHDMKYMTQEILRLICLDTKNQVIHIEDVFKGSLNSSIVHPREIFKIAIAHSSANIIIAHNHPSQDPTPSKEDINITVRIKKCGDIMGIHLLDHLIIGGTKYVSLKEKGTI